MTGLDDDARQVQDTYVACLPLDNDNLILNELLLRVETVERPSQFNGRFLFAIIDYSHTIYINIKLSFTLITHPPTSNHYLTDAETYCKSIVIVMSTYF